jgi:hypothetical protein
MHNTFGNFQATSFGLCPGHYQISALFRTHEKNIQTSIDWEKGSHPLNIIIIKIVYKQCKKYYIHFLCLTLGIPFNTGND